MLASRIKWNLTICIQDALKSLSKVMSSQERLHEKVSAGLSPLQSIKVCIYAYRQNRNQGCN